MKTADIFISNLQHIAIESMPQSLGGVSIRPLDKGAWNGYIHPLYLADLINLVPYKLRAWRKRRGIRRPR